MFALTLMVGAFAMGQEPKWPNSTHGIHRFLTFDSGVPTASINKSTMSGIDFVWGAVSDPDRIRSYRQLSIAVSKYIPYAWDPNATRSLAWWQAKHPSWVLYKCDRKTPAWYGNLIGRNVPFDVTNSDVIAWQIERYAMPAVAAGFTSIAADMFITENHFDACGIWESPGTWKQLYGTPPSPPAPVSNCSTTKTTGCPCWWNASDIGCACCDGVKCCQAGSAHGSIQDKHRCIRCINRSSKSSSSLQDSNVFAMAQISWLVSFKAALAKLNGTPLNLIPNCAFHGKGLPWTDPIMAELRKSADGILDEAGWTGWGSGRTAEPEWGNLTMHALATQAAGNAYYSINECGPGVGNASDPSLREWIVGSYLMSKSTAAAVYISGIQDYGYMLPHWVEFDVPIGAPLALPSRNSTSGAWQRAYSNGTVVVNAQESDSCTIELEPGRCYRNIVGLPVSTTSLVIPPLSAAVLTFTACK